jgi:cupin fold WbuC family metalloprotein
MRLGDPRQFRLDRKGKSPAYFSLDPSIAVDASLVAELKAASREAGGKNVRICLHSGPEAPIQDMVVLAVRDSYYRPHRHLRADESYFAIEGSAAIFQFDQSGFVLRTDSLEPGRTFLARVPAGRFHCVIPLTEVLVYHEYRAGPLEPEATEFAPWSPDGDASATAAFVRSLLKSRS